MLGLFLDLIAELVHDHVEIAQTLVATRELVLKHGVVVRLNALERPILLHHFLATYVVLVEFFLGKLVQLVVELFDSVCLELAFDGVLAELVVGQLRVTLSGLNLVVRFQLELVVTQIHRIYFSIFGVLNFVSA